MNYRSYRILAVILLAASAVMLGVMLGVIGCGNEADIAATATGVDVSKRTDTDTTVTTVQQPTQTLDYDLTAVSFPDLKNFVGGAIETNVKQAIRNSQTTNDLYPLLFMFLGLCALVAVLVGLLLRHTRASKERHLRTAGHLAFQDVKNAEIRDGINQLLKVIESTQK